MSHRTKGFHSWQEGWEYKKGRKRGKKEKGNRKKNNLKEAMRKKRGRDAKDFDMLYFGAINTDFGITEKYT